MVCKLCSHNKISDIVMYSYHDVSAGDIIAESQYFAITWIYVCRKTSYLSQG